MIRICSQQTTLKSSFSLEGIGTHSGLPVSVIFRPAPENTGIVFIRTDISNAKTREVHAVWNNVSDSSLCTVITNEHSVSVQTVEHILAALSGMGVDNAYVDISAQEAPILDGSSYIFAKKINEVGLKRQKCYRKFLKIVEPVIVRDKERWIAFVPSHGLSISIECKLRSMADQFASFIITPVSFLNDISQARTFGFLEDVNKLLSLNLAKGSSLENAVVFDNGKILNPEGLRLHNEQAAHKVLDTLGDISLVGNPILGSVIGSCTGHALNVALIKELFSQKNSWEIVSVEDDILPQTPDEIKFINVL